MEKEFIPYTEALALKELGFDEPCFGIYSKYYGKMKYSFLENTINSNFIRLGDKVNHLCTTPLYQQAFRWFRENYSYHHSVYYHKSSKFECRIADSSDNNLSDDLFNNMYLTYEEAELECLKKLIEIVKNGEKSC